MTPTKLTKYRHPRRSRQVEKMKQSKFAWIPKGEVRLEPWNKDLTPDLDFATIPTVGAIVPSWALIVPRQPVSCIADLEPQARMGLLRHARETVDQFVSVAGGTGYIFEHGARQFGSSTGCGVDQAHLHVVAIDGNLIENVECDFDWRNVSQHDPWADIRGEYLMIFSNEIARGTKLDMPQSQYFRKKIAELSGNASAWNYHTHPFLENATMTESLLRDH